jgi:DNA helicase HerA-like ATPase
MPLKVSNIENVELLPSMANRHGFIAGATGTGKTVSLKLLAEHFSEIGVPVFLADVKGDISGMASVDLPVTFWDVYNETGVPFHSDVSRYSPLLLARLLSLSESQASILSIILCKFKWQLGSDLHI